MMSCILSVALFAAPGAGQSEIGYVIREEVRLSGAPGTGWQQTEIAFGKVRRETSRSPEVVILDPTGDVPVVRLLPKARRWSGIERARLDEGKTPGPFLDGVGIAGDGLEVPAKPFEPTGKKAQIGKWMAREFVSTVRGPGDLEVRIWLAETPEGLPNDALLSVAERVYARKGNPFEAYFRSMKALKGFPVRTVYRFKTGAGWNEVTLTVTRIDRVPLLESAFAAPSGYSRVRESRIPEPSPAEEGAK